MQNRSIKISINLLKQYFYHENKNHYKQLSVGSTCVLKAHDV